MNNPDTDVTPEPQKRMTTNEMLELYEVQGFQAPFVVVTRKSDGKRGSLEFEHYPRFYFNFVAAGT
jgi:hypothetical protein